MPTLQAICREKFHTLNESITENSVELHRRRQRAHCEVCAIAYQVIISLTVWLHKKSSLHHYIANAIFGLIKLGTKYEKTGNIAKR